MSREEMIEVIRELTGEKSDALIKYRIELSNKLIQNFLNYKDKDMIDKDGNDIFALEIINFSQYLTEQGNTKGLKSKTQGERSETYQDGYDIPKHILDLLPLPKVVV